MTRSILALTAVAAALAFAGACAWAAPAQPKAAASAPTVSESRLVVDTWDWPDAMRKVTGKFTGTQGMVLHIGDSITYANPYGSWARYGKGKTDSDKEILKWMHTGENNDLDGWYMAAFDVPNRGGSYTAVSGMRLDQALAGGFHGLPPMSEIIRKYNPQVVIFMLGSNDASQGRSLADFRADLEKAVRIILDNNTILVLSTIPPHVHKLQLAQDYNKAIVEVARQHKLPLIDFYGQILTRQPGMAWDGTLLNKGDVHPTAAAGDVNSGSEPTPENLTKVGYLLRGWLSVQKIKDVKAKAIDPVEKATPAQKKDAGVKKASDAAKTVAPHVPH